MSVCVWSRVLGFFATTALASATTLFFQPSGVSTGVGQMVTVDVAIDQVTDLYGWQFDLTFDPTIVSALQVTEDGFLATGGATFFIPGSIDNVGGTVTATADSLETAIAGVTGGGLLAQFQFQTLALGTTALSISNIMLVDSNINPIMASSTDGAIVVTPEPSELAPLACCLLVLPLSRKAWRSKFLLTALGPIVTFVLAAGASQSARAADIATAQFDSSRTMANGSEVYLTTSNVNGTRFGKLFSRTVDGAIFAQPLYLQGLMVAGKKTNVVYTATSHNNVYAFDADNPAASAPIWSVNLGQYDTPSGWNTGIGVISTPTIVRSSGAIYIIAATLENGSRVFRLHALDLLNGAEKFNGPVVISGSVTGTAADAVNGVVSFDANRHVQRTGLAVSGSNVVFAFSADRDHAPYHGWVFSYTVGTLLQTGVFSVSVNNPNVDGSGSGIWQSGRAPAVDSTGAVYFETGNGTNDGTGDFGESFVKLASNSLSLSDWFTPSSWQALNDVDYDLSSTGPNLIPGTTFLVGGAKSGIVYLLSTANLGHLSPVDAGVLQQFSATSSCVIPYIDQGCAQIMGQVFWSTAPTPTLYVWGVHDVVRAYQFSNGLFNVTPVSTGSMQAYYPGGMMALSSYLGTAGTGILWATTFDNPDNGEYFGPGVSGPATLHALDANNLSNELWNSSQNPMRDALGTFASFAPPVAVNGKVYTPTFSNQLVVYGLLNGPVPGDVNGDSVVNCTDMSIVKASYGKSTGQPGFDLRADVNGDGAVNILDLATVSRQLPPGTVCK
jgi:hypothetical protein